MSSQIQFVDDFCILTFCAGLLNPSLCCASGLDGNGSSPSMTAGILLGRAITEVFTSMVMLLRIAGPSGLIFMLNLVDAGCNFIIAITARSGRDTCRIASRGCGCYGTAHRMRRSILFCTTNNAFLIMLSVVISGSPVMVTIGTRVHRQCRGHQADNHHQRQKKRRYPFFP